MRVVVIGATGNTGSSLMKALSDDSRIDELVGIARRKPKIVLPKTEWVVRDIGRDDLASALAGAQAVVHLAWLIQPSRDEATLRRVNVDGSRRVFEATAQASVPALVYASSVGAYSPGPKDRFVDETWPTNGIASSFYARHKAEVERLLDDFELAQPGVRVVRLRPGLIFKREAATGIRRLFAGPFLPNWALRPGLLPVLPLPAGLSFQAVHSDDVADAYRGAILSEARGAFNIAADDPIDAEVLGRVLEARPLVVSPRLVRAAAAGLWQARLQPTPPGWLDLALAVPLIDSSRAHADLGWTPRHTGQQALAELLDGLRWGAKGPTPPLEAQAGGPARLREIMTGIGARDR